MVVLGLLSTLRLALQRLSDVGSSEHRAQRLGALREMMAKLGMF
jgi:hypothetical protein